MQFSIKDSSVSMTKSPENCRFGHIYWRNPYWKTSYFVRRVNRCFKVYVCYFPILDRQKAFKKLWKVLFLSSKKLSLSTRYSNFCITPFSSFSVCCPFQENFKYNFRVHIHFDTHDVIVCLNRN